MKRKETVLVAMSGGVDSSVVAAMMKARGYDVIGLTMQIWQESQTDPRHSGCCSLGAVEDARRVARILDIPHYVMNFREEFKEAVINNFVEEYSRGRTPNPCVQCNKKVKFDHLVSRARELGCDWLATGHYARIRRFKNGSTHLLKSRGGKDQSYVLYMLQGEALEQTLFPLGELPGKADTRRIAKDYGLPVYNKPDSQEICFVSEAGGYREFIKKQNPDLFEEGEIVDSEGKVIGEHSGLVGYTVGQRKGIGLTVNNGRPLYVLKLATQNNQLVVGHEEELETHEVRFEEAIWSEELDGPQEVTAKIRYNMEDKPAVLYPGSTPRLVFKNPVRSVTPGQIAVAYRGKRVLGGGVICGP